MELTREAVLRTFLAEAEEGLGQMEEAIVCLEASPQDEQALHGIFRIAHTLKGNADALGFQKVTELAHALEDLLERLRAGDLAVTGGLATLLLQAVDALRLMVPAGAAGGEEALPGHESLLERLRARTPVADLPGAALPGERRRSPGRRADDLRDSAGGARTLRVEIGKLDRMLNLTGEIAIARGRLTELLERGDAATGQALETHREADRLHLELQEQVMKVRMVPVGPTFRQFIRTVRDLATAHGKQARLAVEGADVEVDTTVVDHLRDPLTHMVRNAVDHGIEPTAQRKAAGKDPCGRITLRALHEAGTIVIQVQDDGSGLDRARIAERARKRGLLGEAEKLGEAEVHRLIFEPGFSTAEAVTDLSGRGVGMDVVRRNVEALRGSVAVDSRAGAGTTITIRLPLTLAIIEGFGVGVGAESYVVPMESVIECLELPPGEERRPGGRGVLDLRGEPLPYVRLRDHFGVGGEAPARENVLVVRHNGGRAGLAIDALYGERRTVIKPLGKLFDRLPGVSGSAILGNGRVALILDVPALLRDAVSHARAEAGDAEGKGAAP